MTNGGENKTRNRLWLARKRRGLKQKQVAYLLGHHNIDQVSRYENGLRLPKLQAALRLEIIFGLPVRLLFKDLHDQLRDDIRQRAEVSHALKESLKDTLGDGICSYADLLNDADISSEQLENAARHAREMVNRVSDLHQIIKPTQ